MGFYRDNVSFRGPNQHVQVMGGRLGMRLTQQVRGSHKVLKKLPKLDCAVKVLMGEIVMLMMSRSMRHLNRTTAHCKKVTSPEGYSQGFAATLHKHPNA